MLKKIYPLVFSIALPSLVFAQMPKKLPLDGQKYIAEVQEDGKKKPHGEDELSFTAGKFKSILFSDWGFARSSAYEVTIDSTSKEGVKIYTWVAEVKNDIKDKMTYSGTIEADTIEGTIEIFDAKRGTVRKNYTFTGTLKKKPGSKSGS